jgi:1-acyl-sn-glycerol-3-phosphate acyltransferase
MAIDQPRSVLPSLEWPRLPAPVAMSARTLRRFGALASTWFRLRKVGGTRTNAAEWREVAGRLQAVAAHLCTKNDVRFDLRGPPPPRGCIIVANHVSYVDTLVLPSLLPCTCIAKREVAAWPLIGPLTVRLGVLFVDRDSASSGAVVLRQSIRALEAGVAVIAFPEGTTSEGTSLLPFKRGIFGVARRLGVPVVAAALCYDDPRIAWTGGASFLGHYIGSVAGRIDTTVRISFSAPLSPRSFPSAAALASAARTFIGEELFGRAAA